MRPDILQNKLDNLKTRKDARNVDHDVVKEILLEQGLLKDGQPTLVYDQVTNPVSEKEKENRARNKTMEQQKIDQILEEVKTLKMQMARTTF